jgi:uroporphyrinogen-III synthase
MPETSPHEHGRVRPPALLGSLVGITADRRADEQAELLERRGATVLHAPTIRTRPLVGDERLDHAIDVLIAEPPDAVVVTTALGLRSWIAAAESRGLGAELLAALAASRLLVRGAKAVGAAVTAALEVEWSAPGARASEVVDHLAVEAAGGRSLRLAVQLDGDPDTPLPQRLRDLGHTVIEVPVYQWTMPDDPAPALRLVDLVADGGVDAVTFTSGPSLRNFFALAHDAGRTAEVLAAVNGGQVRAVCVGPVAAEQARALGVHAPVVPVHMRLGAMVQAYVLDRADASVAVAIGASTLVLQGRAAVLDQLDPVALTDRERGVLGVLTRRPGAVVSKATLRREVWAGEDVDDHTVEVTIARLRRRLGPAGGAVETVVRRGYRLRSG